MNKSVKIKEYRGVKENIKRDILAKSNRIDNMLKLVDEEIKKGDKYNHVKFYLKDVENLMEEIKEHEEEIHYCNQQIQEILKIKEE